MSENWIGSMDAAQPHKDQIEDRILNLPDNMESQNTSDGFESSCALRITGSTADLLFR